MKVLIISLLSIFAIASENYIYTSRTNHKKEPYFLVNHIRISEIESCKNKKCRAYDLASRKISFSKKLEYAHGGTNPTSTLCRKMEGSPEIGVSNKGNDISVCRFADGSYLLTWDLVQN